MLNFVKEIITGGEEVRRLKKKKLWKEKKLMKEEKKFLLANGRTKSVDEVL